MGNGTPPPQAPHLNSQNYNGQQGAPQQRPPQPFNTNNNNNSMHQLHQRPMANPPQASYPTQPMNQSQQNSSPIRPCKYERDYYKVKGRIPMRVFLSFIDAPSPGHPQYATPRPQPPLIGMPPQQQYFQQRPPPTSTSPFRPIPPPQQQQQQQQQRPSSSPAGMSPSVVALPVASSPRPPTGQLESMTLRQGSPLPSQQMPLQQPAPPLQQQKPGRSRRVYAPSQDLQTSNPPTPPPKTEPTLQSYTQAPAPQPHQLQPQQPQQVPHGGYPYKPISTDAGPVPPPKNKIDPNQIPAPTLSQMKDQGLYLQHDYGTCSKEPMPLACTHFKAIDQGKTGKERQQRKRSDLRV